MSRTADNSIDCEKLSLEILRYFDFFRSQWRLSAPARIFVSKQDDDAATIAKTLSNRLLNAVVPYKLNSTLINNKDSAIIDTHYCSIMAVCCRRNPPMLRQEINLLNGLAKAETDSELFTWKRYLLANALFTLLMVILLLSSLFETHHLKQKMQTAQNTMALNQKKFEEMKNKLPQFLFGDNINDAVANMKKEMATQKKIIAILAAHSPFSEALIAFLAHDHTRCLVNQDISGKKRREYHTGWQ